MKSGSRAVTSKQLGGADTTPSGLRVRFFPTSALCFPCIFPGPGVWAGAGRALTSSPGGPSSPRYPLGPTGPASPCRERDRPVEPCVHATQTPDPTCWPAASMPLCGGRGPPGSGTPHSEACHTRSPHATCPSNRPVARRPLPPCRPLGCSPASGTAWTHLAATSAGVRAGSGLSPAGSGAGVTQGPPEEAAASMTRAPSRSVQLRHLETGCMWALRGWA